MKLLRRVANLGYGSRKQVGVMFRHGRITDASGVPLSADARVAHADVRIDGEPLDPPPGMVIMLHKPAGVTCSHNDAGRLVFDLLPPRFSARRPQLSCVGRLDRDTTGLLLLTDDGALLHRIISPRSHLAKCYKATLAEDVRADAAEYFASGTVRLASDDTPLAPAQLQVPAPRRVQLTITEGRYHQVRRMFAALGNHVESLHRIAIGNLRLGELPPGAWRLLEPREKCALAGWIKEQRDGSACLP